MVPHSARLLCKGNPGTAMALTILSGGLLLVVTDVFARIVIHPAELPVGILTSLLGAPFFLFILITDLRKNRET
jgi:iron complex transport system permease protein